MLRHVPALWVRSRGEFRIARVGAGRLCVCAAPFRRKKMEQALFCH